MTFEEAMRAAFEDELQKIAGSLQGFTRMGRKPIGVDRMLERETEVESPSEELGLVEEDEEETKMASKFPVKETALVAGGAYGYHKVRQAKRRYDIGKQVETQGGGY